MLRLSLLACLLSAVLAAPKGADPIITEIPSWIKLCNRNDPLLNQCLKEMAITNIPKAKNGVPELDVPPIDPFDVRDMLLEYQQGEVNGKVLFKNSRCYGLSDVIVDAVRVNLDDGGRFRLEADIRLKRIFLEGEYKGQGKIITFPIDGKGVFNNTITDIVGTWNLTGDYYQRDGRTFLRLSRFSFLPEVGNMKLYASNLFTGSEELNNAALMFANQFWPVLYKELLPYADEAWDKVMREEINRVLRRIPFDVMFPDS